MSTLPSIENVKPCLNCLSSLEPQAQYCPACGQRVRDTPLPVREFLGDFLQDYFTVDSKFFRSVGMLLWKPGVMTSTFNAGKRVSFIAPFRFYIFVSVAYFFLLAITTRDSDINFLKDRDRQPEAQLQLIDSLMADTSLYANRDKLQEEYDKLRKNAEIEPDSAVSSANTFTFDLNSVEIEGVGGLDDALNERWQRIKQNPEAYKQAIFKAASIGVFFLLPLFALLLMVLHYRRSSFYVNHLVFSVHFHTYMFFVLTIYLLLGVWSVEARHWLLLLSMLLYYGMTIRIISKNWPRRLWKKVLIMVFLALFASLIVLAFSIDSGENDVVALFILGAGYLTLSLMNGYGQGFLRAVAKSLMIAPVYLLFLVCTLIGVAVAGILLA